MRGIKNKESNKWKKLSVFLILLIVLVVLLNSVKNVYQKKQAAQEALSRMEKEMGDLENRDKFLKESINKMATKEGIEFEMRQKLNVAAAGEKVAIIVDEETPPSVQSLSLSSWQKIKNFFIDLFR
jgi:cell division protein FtsB